MENTKVLALSVSLIIHLRGLAQFIEHIRRKSNVKILVGGNAFSAVDGLWRKVGADAYADCSVSALAAVDNLTTS